MTTALQLKFPTNGKKLSKFIVEAGHIYTNEHPTLEHQRCAEWGNWVSNCLCLAPLGAEIKKWLFIDNYNPRFEKKPQDLDITGYIKSLKLWGFSPDKVEYEADFVKPAKDRVAYLQEQGYAGKHHKTGKTVLRKGDILLYDPESDKYMCALLDACLYLQKLEQADVCITVLDPQYTSQQKDTLTILKKLGANTTTIFPFFYSTSNSQPDSSVDSSNIFPDGNGDCCSTERNNHPKLRNSNLSFVQPAIDLLQIVAKLSGSVSPKPSLEDEVRKYGI